MNVRGQIAQQEVLVLIDYGASQNFILAELVENLGIPKVGSNIFRVLMGTGVTMKGKGVCREMVVTLQNIEIMEDFLPLHVRNGDVILGMQWIESLGGMQVNWKTMTMKFKVGKVVVTLRGDPSLCN